MRVIKFGGHAMTTEGNSWMEELARRWKNGEQFIVVHGGGPAIDEQLEIEGIESEFVEGFRITTPAVMKVVEAVLTGTVLRSVVRYLVNAGLPAVGITGGDAGLITVRLKDNGKFGLVGDVLAVEPRLLQALLQAGFIPVISPVSVDENGTVLNVNADLVAGAIAGAVTADEVIFMTDVPGIYRNWPDLDSVIGEITVTELRSMKFEKGMIPKVSALVSAIDSGAKSARVIDGRSLKAFEDALHGRGGTWVKP